jgi:hypothetical protein
MTTELRTVNEELGTIELEDGLGVGVGVGVGSGTASPHLPYSG